MLTHFHIEGLIPVALYGQSLVAVTLVEKGWSNVLKERREE